MAGFAYRPKLVRFCCIFLVPLVVAVIASDEGTPWTYLPERGPFVETLESQTPSLFVADLVGPGPGPTAPLKVDPDPGS
ncbi:MAG TPA: hypothetical protein VGO24_01320 [Solirubrobacterales bacterium]|jgi:hypothetical protein|nr:hypothetical protein [Solirubrobacterales bacterium]